MVSPMADDAGRDVVEAQQAYKRARTILAGRAAYNGYRTRTGGTKAGRAMPLWDDLPLGEQDAWCASALAVVRWTSGHLSSEVAG